MDKGRMATDRQLATIEKKLTAIYNRAITETGDKLKKYLKSLENKENSLLDAIKEAKSEEDRHKAEKAYESFMINKTLRSKHFNTLSEEYAKELLKVNQTAVEYVNGRMPAIYATNYNFTAQQIEAETKNAISYEIVNEEAVKTLVKADGKSLLPYKKLDPAKDIPWNMKAVNSEVLQGILQGESIPKISKRLSNVGVKNKDSAIRAARTLVTKVENKGGYDAAIAAEEKGVIMKKRWVATGDSRTRAAHIDAWSDYGTREDAIGLDEPFIVGGEELMFAGDDSNASGWNVYNCRCRTPYFPDGFTSILPPEKRGKIRVKFVD